jgi:hypothetical protein
LFALAAGQLNARPFSSNAAVVLCSHRCDAVNICLLETAGLLNLDLSGAARLTVQQGQSAFTGITTSAIS